MTMARNDPRWRPDRLGSDFLSFSVSATKLYDSLSFNGLNTLKVDATWRLSHGQFKPGARNEN